VTLSSGTSSTRATLEGGPRVVRDDGEAAPRLEQPRRARGRHRNHAPDAGHLQRGGRVELRDRAADDRRAGDHRDQHAGHHDVGAELRRAADDRGAVEQRQRRAEDVAQGAHRPQRQRGRVGHRQLRGGEDELAERQGALARRVDDLVILGEAAAGVDLPALRGGGDQHVPRGRAGAPELVHELADARRAVGVLVAVLRVADGLADDDAVERRAELGGDQHRQRAAHALAHLGAVAHDRGRAVGRDVDEHVRREAGGVGLVILRGGGGAGAGPPARLVGEGAALVDRQREAAEGEVQAGEEGPPRDEHRAAHGPPSATPAAFLIAARIRTYVPQRHRLPAIDASMSASVGRGVAASSAAAVMIWPAWQ
jgi:hypothetical protein